MSTDIYPVFITVTLDKDRVKKLVELSEYDAIDIAGVDAVVHYGLEEDTDVFRILVFGYSIDKDWKEIVEKTIKLFEKVKITFDGFTRREELVLHFKLDKITTPSGIEVLTYAKNT